VTHPRRLVSTWPTWSGALRASCATSASPWIGGRLSGWWLTQAQIALGVLIGMLTFEQVIES
jgi:hypothetical protein